MSHGSSADQRRSIQRLADQGVLTPEQAEAVIAELDRDTGGATVRGGVWEVLGYAGGALVLGGAGLLLGMSWEDLSRVVRVGLLAVATLVLAAGGLLISGGPRGLPPLAAEAPAARGRIVAVLFALCSGTAAMAVVSALDHHESIVSTVVGLLVAVAGYLVLPSAPGLLAAAGFSFGCVLAVVDEVRPDSTAGISVGLVLLGVIWAALGGTRRVRQHDLALGAGAVIALAGAQWPVSASSQIWGYTLTLCVAVACFAAFLSLRATILLVVGVLGVTIAVPEAVWDFTGGAIGGPVIVLIVGAVLLATGGAGLRLRRAASRTEPSD